MFKFSLIPREEKFFDLFERSAQNVFKAATKLKQLVDTWENVEQTVKEISDLEHEGDTITHEIVAQLHRTFITPFDREDIALLGNSLDDVIDFIDAAADAMVLYKVNRPDQRAKELADIIVRTAVELEKVMPKLRRRIELSQILKCCIEINRLENEADNIFRAAMVELFDDNANMTEVIKWREIYQHMENATDRCEDVANVLEGVALKHG